MGRTKGKGIEMGYVEVHNVDGEGGWTDLDDIPLIETVNCQLCNEPTEAWNIMANIVIGSASMQLAGSISAAALDCDNDIAIGFKSFQFSGIREDGKIIKYYSSKTNTTIASTYVEKDGECDKRYIRRNEDAYFVDNEVLKKIIRRDFNNR